MKHFFLLTLSYSKKCLFQPKLNNHSTLTSSPVSRHGETAEVQTLGGQTSQRLATTFGCKNSKTRNKVQNSCPLPMAQSFQPKSSHILDSMKIGLLYRVSSYKILLINKYFYNLLAIIAFQGIISITEFLYYQFSCLTIGMYFCD